MNGKRLAAAAAEANALPVEAYCPTCKQNRRIFHDGTGAAFFTRHLQAGKGNWCDKSGKKVTKR